MKTDQMLFKVSKERDTALSELAFLKEQVTALQQEVRDWRFIATENEKARKRDAEEITRLRRLLGEIP